MAAANITDSQRIVSLETVDRIFQLTSKSIGIVDLIGNIKIDDEMDDHSLNSATWAVKDMLTEIQRLIEQAPTASEVAA